jgi:RNA polymerase sigma factor (sigma-70 family)
VALSRRELLLRVHSFRLRREDLEDCYGQATLELIAHARRGGGFASRTHLANVLEQRFVSRIRDRRRAISGRSPMQAMLESAISIDHATAEPIEIIDMRVDVETIVIRREQLRRICAVSASLTPEQRLVLACQVGLQMDRSAFCERFGWSAEKYRKVAQRARARLRTLMADDAPDVPPGGAPSERASGTRL